MNRKALIFEAPGQVSVQEENLEEPASGKLLIENTLSAISPGTEMLVYRGQFPKDQPVDAIISALSGQFSYPMKYGYCSVGRVLRLGPGVEPSWIGKQVFSFHPHESHFIAGQEELIVIPADLSPEDAVFLANMETAVNFVMDGAPLIGEKVVIFGQGIIGLLTAGLLAYFPLSQLITLDCLPLRRQASVMVGAHSSMDPLEMGTLTEVRGRLVDGADLVYELSGSPQALDQAIELTGFSGRVVIGSWYGEKRASLDLGRAFHRNRVHLLSSQVSTLAPHLAGRWTKERRFSLAWEMVRQVKPSRFITHRFPIEEASHAYLMVDKFPEESIQVVLTY